MSAKKRGPESSVGDNSVLRFRLGPSGELGGCHLYLIESERPSSLMKFLFWNSRLAGPPHHQHQHQLTLCLVWRRNRTPMSLHLRAQTHM